MLRTLLGVLALLASCEAYTAPASVRGLLVQRRASVPRANLFESLGKIADYNKKYFSTAVSALFDGRTARASHILFGFTKYPNGEEEAATLKSRIEAGELTFAEAAEQYSTCPSGKRGGDLGTFKKGAMVPEFDSVCFDVETPLGDIIQGPIKTQFGHHLIQVYERSEQ
jgi:parvulin-like peptidyl-prolyl isomerase